MSGDQHNVGRKLERQHAGVVHRRDAGADDRTADRDDRPARAGQRNAEPDGDNGHGEEQRQQRDADVVSGAGAGVVSQHRDEMRGPDSATADSGVEADPDRARSALRGPGTMKQADGDRTGEPADGAGQHNQTPVMLGDETSSGPGTLQTPRLACNCGSICTFDVTIAASVARMVNKRFAGVERWTKYPLSSSGAPTGRRWDRRRRRIRQTQHENRRARCPARRFASFVGKDQLAARRLGTRTAPGLRCLSARHHVRC